MLKIKSNMNSNIKPALMQVLCKALNYGIKFNAVECRIGIDGLYFYSEQSAWSVRVAYCFGYWIDIIENDVDITETICCKSVDNVYNIIIDIFY